MTKYGSRTVRVRDVALTFAGGTPSRNQTDYFGGDIPWVKSGEVAQSRITRTEETLTQAGLSASSAKWCEAGSTLIAMYGATAGAVGRLAVRATTNQAVLCAQANESADAGFLFRALESAAPRLLTRAQGSGQPNLNAGIIGALDLPWPDEPIRERVCAVLDLSDLVTSKLDAVLVAKRTMKQALMHEVLTAKRRFPEFADRTFTISRLDDHASEYSKRNRHGWGPDRVKGVIKGVGLEPMRDHVRADDLSRYKIVPADAFAYNPMRLNIGSIARNRSGEECLVSPDYVVFRTEPTLLPGFLDHLRNSLIWSSFVRPAGTGGVRVRIYFRDLAELRIPLPQLDEQRRIVEILDVMDREIALLEQLRTSYDQQKRGLMQRLLSGELTIPDAEPAHA